MVRGAIRGRNAGARFLRIMRFTAACKYARSNGQNCDFKKKKKGGEAAGGSASTFCPHHCVELIL